MYKDTSIEKYLEDLAARMPAPGGGSAAALNAAMAAGLISMVIRYTLGKPKYQKYERELNEILEKSEKLRKDFLNLVDLDVAAYNSKNIKDALSIPFMLCRLCFEAVKLCPALVKKTNPNLISDVAVAVVLFESAFVSAYFSVEINLKVLNDEKFSRQVRNELSRKDKQVRRIRQKTEVDIGQIIRG